MSRSVSKVDNRMVAQLLESILFIIDAVLPMLGKLPPSIVGELEQDLKQMIVRHSFLTVVHACIKKSDLDPSFRWGYRPSDYSRASDYSRPSDYSRWGSSDDDNGLGDSPSTVSPLSYGGPPSAEDGYGMPGRSRYCLVASKQMVGIFLTIWVRSELKDHVRNMKVSCVGRGLMGYLGNKGSISISMSLHETSFCFICSHLTSGQKEGDELRRNSDVMEILKKTRFPRVHGADNEKSPETILEHDRIIWLGDLNYRIALSYRSAKALVQMQNWRALLENDQSRRGAAHLWDGMKGRFISLQLTSIQLTQIGTQEMICTQKRKGEHLLGVTVFCGMEKASINYLTFVENQGFQTTDQFMEYFGLRLSQVMED